MLQNILLNPYVWIYNSTPPPLIINVTLISKSQNNEICDFLAHRNASAYPLPCCTCARFHFQNSCADGPPLSTIEITAVLFQDGRLIMTPGMSCRFALTFCPCWQSIELNLSPRRGNNYSSVSFIHDHSVPMISHWMLKLWLGAEGWVFDQIRDSKCHVRAGPHCRTTLQPVLFSFSPNSTKPQHVQQTHQPMNGKFDLIASLGRTFTSGFYSLESTRTKATALSCRRKT